MLAPRGVQNTNQKAKNAETKLVTITPRSCSRSRSLSSQRVCATTSGDLCPRPGLGWCYRGQRAGRSSSPGAMMTLGTSVRRRKAHEPKPPLAKEGICGTCRREETLGHKSSASSLLRVSPPRPPGSTNAQAASLSRSGGGRPERLVLGCWGRSRLCRFSLERRLEPPVQRFRNAALLGWLVLCATGVTTHFNVQAPPGNSLREVLPRYETAKRWVCYYCVQG
jgi:hypothetical protein